MEKASIVSSPSFAARAQRSEATRVVIWTVVLVGMLVITVLRRWVGDFVIRKDTMFYHYTIVLAVATAVELVLLWPIRRANRVGVLLPSWVWQCSALFDLATAAVLLVIAAFYSPRGPVPALTAPPMLLLPLVVLMSILRLRPMFTLVTGLLAATVHLLLAARVVAMLTAGGGSGEFSPVYFAYGFILILTAVAGMFVAQQVRVHVREAADEAVAHERAERQVFGMQRDLSVARDIQRGLLPTRSPELTGFDVSGMNRPADQTGGDYYDWQPLADGKLAVALADVSGHGIGPALVMAVCRAYSRATAPMLPDPAALLDRLNRLLCDDLPSDRFITFVLAVLDDESGAVHLISAGHGPSLLYRASTGEATTFGGDGMPLGVSPVEQYGPTTSLIMEPGDTLVLLTDEFFEGMRSDGEQFGVDRLCQTLRNRASLDRADLVLGAIDEDVRAFCNGAPQADDMTAIVIRRTARIVSREALSN